MILKNQKKKPQISWIHTRACLCCFGFLRLWFLLDSVSSFMYSDAGGRKREEDGGRREEEGGGGSTEGEKVRF